MIGSENEGIVACLREIELSRRNFVNIVSKKEQAHGGSETDAPWKRFSKHTLVHESGLLYPAAASGRSGRNVYQ